MEWLPVVLELVGRILREVAPHLCDAIEQSVTRTEQPAMAEPDNWTWPSDAQLAEFLRRSDARRLTDASPPKSL